MNTSKTGTQKSDMGSSMKSEPLTTVGIRKDVQQDLRDFVRAQRPKLVMSDVVSIAVTEYIARHRRKSFSVEKG